MRSTHRSVRGVNRGAAPLLPPLRPPRSQLSVRSASPTALLASTERDFSFLAVNTLSACITRTEGFP